LYTHLAMSALPFIEWISFTVQFINGIVLHCTIGIVSPVKNVPFLCSGGDCLLWHPPMKLRLTASQVKILSRKISS
jgi:hypothetical protein